MLRREFDARANGSAGRSTRTYFEQSAETHATPDKEHRGGKAKNGSGHNRRCCADVLPRFLHSAEPQKRQSVVGAQDQESAASGPQFVMLLACEKATHGVLCFANIICPRGYEVRCFAGARSTNSCSSEQLKHSVPTRFITCSHDEIAVWMSASSDAIESWLLSFTLR